MKTWTLRKEKCIHFPYIRAEFKYEQIEREEVKGLKDFYEITKHKKICAYNIGRKTKIWRKKIKRETLWW